MIIDLSKITFEEPIEKEQGLKYIEIKHKGEELTIPAPFTCLEYTMHHLKINEELSKFTIDLSFKDRYRNSAIEDFHDFMNVFEKQIISTAHKNCKKWFSGELLSRKRVKDRFSLFMRIPINRETGEEDKRYNRSLKVKVPYENKEWGFELYDENITRIENPELVQEFLVKSAIVKCKIRCAGIYIYGTRFCCNFELVRCDVLEKHAPLSFALNSDSEEDNYSSQS